MASLSARLLLSVGVLLLVFFGATIAVLDIAFRKAGEQAQEDILDGHLMQLLASADPNAAGEMGVRRDLPEPRFGNIGSGLYAEIRDLTDAVIWRSPSALGLEIPSSVEPQLGDHQFARETLEDGTPLLTLSLRVQWEIAADNIGTFTFRVAESLDSFNRQVARFRQQLFGWFAVLALIMLLSISVAMRRVLQPLRQIEHEIGEIEAGHRASLSGAYPTELRDVARNMNLLIDNERARSERYRLTLDNLAHSLKTPLAAMRSLLSDAKDAPREDRAAGRRLNEQIDRMDEIVRYQLRKPAATPAENLGLAPVRVADSVERLVEGLMKVHRDKSPQIAVDVPDGLLFRGDSGDLLEMAGNLVDNACKWCARHVKVTARPAGPAGGLIFSVADDGPGIPAEAADALLERGMRLDEATPGHGIGLAIVRDIARSYGGHLSVGQADLGGARFTITIPPVAGRQN